MSIYNDMANDAGYRYGTQENAQMAQILEQEEIENYYRELEYKHYCEQEYFKYQEEVYEYEMMLQIMRHECAYMWR